MNQRRGGRLEGPLTVGSTRHAGCPERGDGGLSGRSGPTAAAGGARTPATTQRAASGHGGATGATSSHTPHRAFLCPGGDNFTDGWGGLGLRG